MISKSLVLFCTLLSGYSIFAAESISCKIKRNGVDVLTCNLTIDSTRKRQCSDQIPVNISKDKGQQIILDVDVLLKLLPSGRKSLTLHSSLAAPGLTSPAHDPVLSFKKISIENLTEKETIIDKFYPVRSWADQLIVSCSKIKLQQFQK